MIPKTTIEVTRTEAKLIVLALHPKLKQLQQRCESYASSPRRSALVEANLYEQKRAKRLIELFEGVANGDS
jgi:hypothetical protein